MEGGLGGLVFSCDWGKVALGRKDGVDSVDALDI